MIEKGLEMEKEDYMRQHCLHGLRVRCVGIFRNASNDLVRRCVTAWACQTRQCWHPQSLNQTLKPLSVCEDTAPAVRTKGWSDPAVVR